MSRSPRWIATALAALLLAVGAVAGAAPAQAGAMDTYRLTTSTGRPMPTGSVDIGLHCYATCGTFVQAPFPLTLYGQTYNRLYVTADGTVQTTSRVDPYYRCPGSYAARGPIFLALRDFLSTEDPGEGVFTRTSGAAPHRQFVVEWRTHSRSEPGNYRFALSFAEDSGAIETTYGAVGPADTAIIGAENSYGATSTRYACGNDLGTPQVSRGLRLTYTPATRTTPLAPAPRSFTIAKRLPDTASILVTWEAPAGLPAHQILGYQVSRDGRGDLGGGPFVSTLQTPYDKNFVFRHLVPGFTYTFRVRAITPDGWGQVATVRGGLPATARP